MCPLASPAAQQFDLFSNVCAESTELELEPEMC